MDLQALLNYYGPLAAQGLPVTGNYQPLEQKNGALGPALNMGGGGAIQPAANPAMGGMQGAAGMLSGMGRNGMLGGGTQAESGMLSRYFGAPGGMKTMGDLPAAGIGGPAYGGLF